MEPLQDARIKDLVIDRNGSVLTPLKNGRVESIRTASTGMLLSALDTTRPIVVVTLSVRKERKSTFAMSPILRSPLKILPSKTNSGLGRKALS